MMIGLDGDTGEKKETKTTRYDEIRVPPCAMEHLFRLMTDYLASNSKAERDDFRGMMIRMMENIISLKDGCVSKKMGDPLIKKIGLEKMVEIMRNCKHFNISF